MDVTIHDPHDDALRATERETSMDGGRLIVVSNRVMLPGATQAGGLAQAMLTLLQQRGGSWLGWSGHVSDAAAPQARQIGRIRYLTWDLARAEYDDFYAEYANRTLWPLLHGRTDLMTFDRAHLQGYLQVNERFAELVAGEAGPDDRIWIHDYHLMPLASLLRARGVANRIGFFLHTPLPAPRTLVTLPQHRAMLGLLAACDVIGVDRLDYSKGLPQRLRAFRHLLGHNPALSGRATYLQVTPESRREVSEYRQLSREVQRLVGDINGHYAAPAWTPVRYVNRGYSHATLAGFYRLARVCLVTPLRDGMNLVAKEFIACQNPQDPGVLVLSEFAGAAAELGDSALIVNPYDIEGCSRAMARALSMPLEERQQRWQSAMRVLREGNIQRWCENFLDALAQARRPAARTAAGP